MQAEKEVKIFTNFALEASLGRFAEWLGAGLQNRLQRFESATDLINLLIIREVFFIVVECVVTYLRMCV